MLDEPTGGSLLAGFVMSYLVLVAGWVLFASGLLRAGLAARGRSIAVIVCAPLAILPAPTALRLLPLAIAVAFVARGRAS